MSEKDMTQGPVEGEIEIPDQDELSDEELDDTSGGGIIAPHMYARPSAFSTVNQKSFIVQSNLNVKTVNTNIR